MIKHAKKILILLLWLMPLAAYADDGIEIATLVNGKPISKFDLEQQTKILLVTANIQPSADAVKYARKRGLEQLIENILRREEAQKHSMRVSKEEIRQSIQQALDKNQSVDGFVAFLEKNDIYADSFYSHIAADLLWRKVIEQKIVPRIVLSQNQIDSRLTQITQNLKQPNFLLSWIVLRFENKQSEKRARELAQQLRKQLREGASFDSLARNFSSGSSASQGGDLGWMSKNTLPVPLQQLVQQMKIGNISAPVRLADSFYLVYLRDRREAEDVPEEKISLRLTALRIPIALGASPRRLQQRVRQQFPGCKQADNYAKRIGGDASDLGFVPAADLSENLKRQLRKAKIGVIIPSMIQEGVQEFLALCERKIKTGQPVSRRMVENQMLNEEAQIRARQKLRDLRRDANIEQR